MVDHDTFGTEQDSADTIGALWTHPITSLAATGPDRPRDVNYPKFVPPIISPLPPEFALRYAQMPLFYSYTAGTGWRRRKKASKCIGRMYYVPPSAGEKYYLRRLLLEVAGPMSFEDLKTVDGVLHDT